MPSSHRVSQEHFLLVPCMCAWSPFCLSTFNLWLGKRHMGRCSLIQAVSQEEPSDRKLDHWPLWMAGHVQLKFVMTECSKTQICLMHHIWYIPHLRELPGLSGKLLAKMLRRNKISISLMCILNFPMCSIHFFMNLPEIKKISLIPLWNFSWMESDFLLNKILIIFNFILILWRNKNVCLLAVWLEVLISSHLDPLSCRCTEANPTRRPLWPSG